MKVRILWTLFYIQTLSGLSVLVFFQNQISLDLSRNILPSLVLLTPPLLLFVFHAGWTLGWKKAGLFAVIAFISGCFFETMGLKYGVPFGGTYGYLVTSLNVGTVPFFVLLFWIAFAYTGYSVVSSFLTWRKVDKPNKRNKNRKGLALLIVADAWVITAIDLLMEPLQVAIGSWQWSGRADYFGVPVGNFIGWFIVSAFISFIFRLVEWYWPEPERQRSTMAIPVIGYGIMAVLFASHAVVIGLPTLATLGLLFMLPQVILSLYLRAKLPA